MCRGMGGSRGRLVGGEETCGSCPTSPTWKASSGYVFLLGGPG